MSEQNSQLGKKGAYRMGGLVTTGAVAAVIVYLPRFFHSKVSAGLEHSPYWILGVGILAILFQKYVIERGRFSRDYRGMSDLFLGVHLPKGIRMVADWVARGVISFALACFGGYAGPEGAAIEFSQAFHTRLHFRFLRWSENTRRTDAATSLAAGVAAAFGAPFAGVLFPIELGVGGRSIASAASAISAFLTTKVLASFFPVETFDVGGILAGFQFVSWHQWVGVLGIGVGSGVFSALTVRFLGYTQASFSSLLSKSTAKKIGVGTLLLFLVAAADHNYQDSFPRLLEQVLWLKYSPNEVLLIFLAQLISLTILVSSFGTLGILWPLFSIGGFLGYGLNHWAMQDFMDYAAVAGLTGCAAFCGSILGIPFTAAVLVYEITQNAQVLLPCLLAAMVAQQCREWLKTPNWIDVDLADRGLSIASGRSLAILSSILVKDAMSTDFEVIHEQEVVSGLGEKLRRSKYPFYPVISAHGEFKGLLTTDMIQEQWETQERSFSGGHLSELLEAKDLLYHSGVKSQSVKETDSLSDAVEIFAEFPCVPVLNDNKNIIGLLFSHSIRYAYDREVSKRSFSFLDPVIN